MFLPLRSGLRRLWDGNHMQKVHATAIEKGGDSIQHAAQKYGMPHFTLHDHVHVSGKIEHGSNQERLDMLHIKKFKM